MMGVLVVLGATFGYLNIGGVSKCPFRAYEIKVLNSPIVSKK